MPHSFNKDTIEAELKENDALLSDSIKSLSDVLSPHILHTKKVVRQQGLLEALRLIMNSEQIEWSEASANYFLTHPYSLADLFNKFGLSTRQIQLDKSFWKEGFGSLLAFKKESNDPVALLYENGNYFLCDPESGETQKLNAELAAELLPEAWSFYRNLPNEALSWKQIFSFSLFKTKKDVTKLIFIAGLISALSLLIPYAQEILINDVLPESRLAPLAWMIGLLCASAVVTTGGNLSKVFIELRISNKLTYSLQAALMQRLIRLPLSFFKRHAAGELATRVLGIMRFSQYFSESSFQLLIGIPSALILILFILYLNPLFGALAAGLTFCFLLGTASLIFLSLKKSRLASSLSTELSAKLFQLLSGIDTLHTTGSEMRAFHRFSLEYAKQQSAHYAARYWHTLFQTFCNAFPIACFFMLYVIGAYLISTNSYFNLGEFIAINAAFGSLIGILELFSESLSTLPEMIPGFDELKPILLATPENDPTQQFDCEALEGKIEMRGVSFLYSEQDPLLFNNLNFEINPGELVAIVGASGCGKSTLLRLLLGFEKPTSGNIFYDDKNFDGLNSESIRRQMGVVMQNSQLLSDTLFGNITCGFNYSTDEVWAAVEQVGMADELKALPMGLFTDTGENGYNLSSSQCQLIMLARALIRKSKVLILDEALSNLDIHHQTIMSKTLTQLKATRIIISHRLETLKEADRIFVLKEGCIVESGNFETLISKAGEFSQLMAHHLSSPKGYS